MSHTSHSPPSIHVNSSSRSTSRAEVPVIPYCTMQAHLDVKQKENFECEHIPWRQKLTPYALLHLFDDQLQTLHIGIQREMPLLAETEKVISTLICDPAPRLSTRADYALLVRVEPLPLALEPVVEAFPLALPLALPLLFLPAFGDMVDIMTFGSGTAAWLMRRRDLRLLGGLPSFL